MNEAKIKNTGEVKSHKNRTKGVIVKEIVKLFEELDSGNPNTGWNFYPKNTELDVLILKTPDMIKFGVLVKRIDELEKKFEAMSLKSNEIDQGLTNISKKTEAVKEMNVIQENLADNGTDNSTPITANVNNTEIATQVTAEIQDKVDELITQFKENTKTGDDSFKQVLTKNQRRNERKKNAKTATAQARKPMVSGTAQVSKTWAPKTARAMKLNIAKDYSINDLKK